MPLISYRPKTFNSTAELMIEQSVAICEEFAAQGISLTLRGLYYRLVARDLFPVSRRYSRNARGTWVADPDGTPNTDLNYKWLGDIINDGRLAGRVDWDHLADITRELRSLAHWDDPESILDAVARQYRTYRWAGQPERVEVWIEKDALLGVITGVCNDSDVPYFSCRGYTSQTAMWQAARRLRRYEDSGQRVTVIHLGDHDPSGVDMTRDIRDRLAMFGFRGQVNRIALTMDQVNQYQPPPNPAKITDSRAAEYIATFHDPDIDDPGEARSWELDALDPAVLIALIADEIARHRDDDRWDADTEAMETDRFMLTRVSERWDYVTGILRDDESDPLPEDTPYDRGRAAGYADRESGADYEPDDEDPNYQDGYQDGWNAVADDGNGQEDEDDE
jgi:hypothetical protein